MTSPIDISQTAVDDPGVQALLMRHFDLMRASSPEESCHVMQPDGLLQRGAVVFAARDLSGVVGVGALAQVDAQHGELKSMHTAAEARGRGVARTLLSALLQAARDQDMIRVSLETGSDEMFAPARALYAAHGFTDCPPFGSYTADPLSVFMTRAL